MGPCPEPQSPSLSTDLGSDLIPLPSFYTRPAPHSFNPVSPTPWELELTRLLPQLWFTDPLFGNSFLQREPQVLGARKREHLM